ncbi:MAG: MBL fold metallo-hydrolase [Lachnospiraceae bacterium]|nr:MBL fold metallo-hydrolase [Lachnospiraceae bacterium]
MVENIDVFTQNSIRIRDNGKIIYIDPFHMQETPRDADLILITHDHYDHFSPEDIAKVSRGDSVLVVPEKMKSKAAEAAALTGRIETVSPNQSYTIAGVSFDTVRAYNNLKPFHPKSADWVGYILKIDGKRIYIAGDTDFTKDARDAACDIALVPIGGTYTMDAKKAAELINFLQPKIAIPVHYGGIVGRKEDAEIFKSLVKPPVEVVLKMRY